jgi:integrase/recombinase XerD
MTLIGPLIKSFLQEHMPTERGLSPHTCESYAYAFRLLFEYAGEKLGVRPSRLCVEQLDVALVTGFLEHIETERKNSPTTRNARLAAIKSFMRYVEYRLPTAVDQVAQLDAVPFKRHDHGLAVHLSAAEIHAILNAPTLRTRLGVRDRAMLHLCFAAGLRVSELVGLPVSGLTLQPASSVHVMGKGRRQRCLPLWKETARDLRAWMAVRGVVSALELFVNAAGTAMTRAGFEYVLAKHVATAKQGCAALEGKSITPHTLRHSCAVMMLQATRDVRKVALWLGHADLRTTETYLQLDPTEKLEAVEAVLPPALRRGRFKAPDALIASLMDPY